MGHMQFFNIKTFVIPILTILLSAIFWFFTYHSWVHFINTFFVISFIFGIFLFILLVIQEGILDTTSYGFRKFRYQLMRQKTKVLYKEDDFFNPKTPKKPFYIVQPWIKGALLIQLGFILLSIILAFLIA